MTRPRLTGAWWRLGGAAVGLLGLAAVLHRRLRRRMSERELRALVENAPDVVIRFDRALRIRYVNPMVETYTGLSASALVGRTVAELGYPAENVRAWESGLRRVVDAGEPGIMEFSVDTPNGWRHFETRMVPEFGAAGGVASVLGITRDVTTRRAAEERFRRSEAFLAEGQRITRTGSWSGDRTSGAITWSDEHFRIFAADPDVGRAWPAERIRELFWERVHPADRDRVHRAFELAMRDFSPLALEFRLVMPDGAIRHVRCVGRRGSGDEYIGTTMDVTDAHRAEAERRRSEAYLAEAQRLSHTGSWAWKLATGESVWSRETYQIYGFDPAGDAPPYEQVLARAHPDDRAGAHATLQEAFRTGGDVRLRTRVLVPGEPMKWVETYAHQVCDDDGRPVEYIGTVVDVTQRVRAARRQRRAIRARYEAALAERTRIARDMHDGVLQDVTGIALQLGALLPHVRALPDAQTRMQEVVTLAEQTGRRARLAVQGMRAHDGAVELLGQVQQALQDVTALSALALSVRVTGRPRLVGLAVCDAAASIVREAVTNVVKHAHARTVVVTVALVKRRLRLSIRDDGRGLWAGAARPPGDAGHFGVVGMYERASSVGASLTVSSAPGRGTRIRVDVPLARPEAADVA